MHIDNVLGGTMETAVELSGVAKTFTSWLGRNPHVAVEDVSFVIPQGKILGLLGPNGAGKTTIIKMLCGLVLPTRGTLRVMGHDLATKRQKALSHIGAVLEGSRNMHWKLSPLQNLSYFSAIRGQNPETTQRRAQELLERFGLSLRAHSVVGELSRGMQQKVAVMVALITDPEVLLLDEPTIGLDVAVAREVQTLLRSLAREGKTILLTTHQMHVAEAVADEIAILSLGRIVARGTKEALRERAEMTSGENLEEIYLKILQAEDREGKE